MNAPSYAHKNVSCSRRSQRTRSVARSATRTLAASNHNCRQKKVAKKKKQNRYQVSHNISRSHDEDDVTTVLSIPHLVHDDDKEERFQYLRAKTKANFSAQPFAPTLSHRQKRLLRKKLNKIGVPPKICVSHPINARPFGSDDGDCVSVVSAPFHYTSDDQSCFIDDRENMNLPFVSLHQVVETAKKCDSQSLCLIRVLEDEHNAEDDSSFTTARPFEVSFPNHHTKEFSSIKLQESQVFVFLAAMLEYDSDKWKFEIHLWPPSGVCSRSTGEHILDDLTFLVDWFRRQESQVVDHSSSNEHSKRRKPWQFDWKFDREDDESSSFSHDDEDMNDFNFVSFGFLDE